MRYKNHKVFTYKNENIKKAILELKKYLDEGTNVGRIEILIEGTKDEQLY